jgi:hypothetical protein
MLGEAKRIVNDPWELAGQVHVCFADDVVEIPQRGVAPCLSSSLPRTRDKASLARPQRRWDFTVDSGSRIRSAPSVTGRSAQ